MDAYADSHNQIPFTGSLMDGQASQWYESLIDPSTYHVPSTYTFDTFIQELTTSSVAVSPSTPANALLLACVKPVQSLS